MAEISQKIIFISHASEEAEQAKSLGRWLEDLFNIQVFVSSIEPGKEWRKEIDEALRNAIVGLVLATPESKDKPWVQNEVGRLQGLSKPVYVYCWGMNFRDLGSTLNHIQACSFDDPTDKQEEFVASLADKLGKNPNIRLAKKNPLAGARVRHFLDREQAKAAIIDLINDAKETQNEICCAGIANTMFFSGGAGVLQDRLFDALRSGLTARFVFLDPESDSTRRRRIYEFGRVDTPPMIKACISVAEKGEMRKQFKVRLSQDMPFFVCLNHQKAICQPYTHTGTGQATPCWEVEGYAYAL